MEELIDKVIKEIKADIAIGDVTALETLLSNISEENLKAYLREEGEG